LGEAEWPRRGESWLDLGTGSSSRTKIRRVGRARVRRGGRAGPGSGASQLIAQRIPSSQQSSSGGCAASYPRTGAGSCRLHSSPRSKKPAAVATRISSQQVLNVLGANAARVCWAGRPISRGSTTRTSRATRLSRRTMLQATTFNYGVREFGMCAVMNGIALHGGSFRTVARSSCSPITRVTPCAWPR